MGSNCGAIAGKNRQRDQKLLELVPEEEADEARHRPGDAQADERIGIEQRQGHQCQAITRPQGLKCYSSSATKSPTTTTTTTIRSFKHQCLNIGLVPRPGIPPLRLALLRLRAISTLRSSETPSPKLHHQQQQLFTPIL